MHTRTRHNAIWLRVTVFQWATAHVKTNLSPDYGTYRYTDLSARTITVDLFVPVRYEYRRKVHQEKMTPRRYVFAAIRRTLLAAGILTLLVLALSSQDARNSVQQGLLLEVSDHIFIW